VPGITQGTIDDDVLGKRRRQWQSTSITEAVHNSTGDRMGNDRANAARPYKEAIAAGGGKPLDELNPYSPPAFLNTASDPVGDRHEHRLTMILTAWTAVFASNRAKGGESETTEREQSPR
jgi:hypothetical protein